MPTTPLDGRPLSALTPANDVRPTDRLDVYRPTEPLPADQNVTIPISRIAAYVLDLLGGATVTGLTPEIVAALFAASAPSSANAFVTEADLPTRFQALSVDAGRLLEADDAGDPAIIYDILRPAGNVTLAYIAADAANSQPGGFSPVGIWQKTDGTRVFVDYDVTSNNPVPHAGGTTGDFLPLTGGELSGPLTINGLPVLTGPATDIYIAANGTVASAVIIGTFANGELQGAQPAGSVAGTKFTTTTYGYEYQRGASGALVWCRYVKS